MDIIKAIEIYLGYKPDFTKDIILSIDNDILNIQWNITDKPKPTMEELQTIYDTNIDSYNDKEKKIELYNKLRNLNIQIALSKVNQENILNQIKQLGEEINDK